MNPIGRAWAATLSLKSACRTAAFVLRVLPMLPSKWLDRFTSEVDFKFVELPGLDHPAELYRPGDDAVHAGVVMCLGVIPFDTTHPQVKRLAKALARRGFVVLLVWSVDMRSLRISPDDIERITSAYQWLVEQPFVDRERSGFLGTCVGAGFVLAAAAQPDIRDQVRFVSCFAPFGSLRTLALDIGSATTEIDGIRRPWNVDQLSRKVYIRTMTAELEPEGSLLETAWFEERAIPPPDALSPAARCLVPLLQSTDRDRLEQRLNEHPELCRKVDAVCPIAAVGQVRASHIGIGHDRDDTVLPFGESQRLYEALRGKPGVRLTEFHMFQHADPTKRRIAKARLLFEMWKFTRFCAPALQYADRPGHRVATRDEG